MKRRGSESEEPVTSDVARPPNPQPQYEAAAPRPAPMEMTLIGKGARLEGNLISAASLKIEGSVKGQITAEGDVIVAPEADVAADIRATNVTVAGKYSGNITAKGNLELESSARVEGNVSCASLIVNRGAVFSGESVMGTEPIQAQTKEPSSLKVQETAEQPNP